MTRSEAKAIRTKVISLYEEGFTKNHISSTLSVSSSFVRRTLVDAEVIVVATEDVVSYADISKELNISPYEASKLCKTALSKMSKYCKDNNMNIIEFLEDMTNA